MYANTIVIPHQNVLKENSKQLFGVNPAALQSFLVASYDEDVYELLAPDFNVQLMNDSQIHCIFQVLLHRKLLEHYRTLRRLMCLLTETERMG